MNTAFFREDGSCISIAEGNWLDMDFPTAVHRSLVDQQITPNDIWCDENGMVHPRQSMNLLVAINTISQIPPGTLVAFQSDSVVVDDGTLEIESPFTTTITAILSNPKFKITTVEVPCEV